MKIYFAGSPSLTVREYRNVDEAKREIDAFFRVLKERRQY